MSSPKPTPEQLMQAVIAFARKQRSAGMTAEKVRDLLVAKGLSPGAAAGVVSSLATPQGQTSPLPKNEVPKNEVPKLGYCKFSDLPRSCPSCGRKFFGGSEASFRRNFPRRYRWHTIAFIAAVCTLGVGTLGWLGLGLAMPLGGWAMRWHKRVKVHCSACKWSKGFVVSTRG